MNVQFARRMENVQPSAIRELLRLGADPSIISFGGGYPDASIFVGAMNGFMRDDCGAWPGIPAYRFKRHSQARQTGCPADVA